MIWMIRTSHLRNMPLDFESLSPRDAEGIMQAWADNSKERFAKLSFVWFGSRICEAFFKRQGREQSFMKIELKED